MTSVRAVDFATTQGPFAEPWADAPGLDAFLRAARRVNAAVTDAVRALELPSAAEAVVLDVRAAEVDQVEVVLRRSSAAARAAVVLVPDAVAELTAGQRAGLVLETWRVVLIELAQRDEWRGVAEALEAVRSAGGSFVWTGTPRSDADGTAARVRGGFAADGFARLVVDVRDPEGQVRHSPVMVGWTQVGGLAQAQQSLQWAGGAVLVEPCVDVMERSAGIVPVTEDDLVADDPLVGLEDALEASPIGVNAQWTDRPEDVMAIYNEVMSATLAAAERPLDVPVGFVSR